MQKSAKGSHWQKWISSGYHWVRNQELLVLICGLIVAGGLWAFIELADEVMEGDTRDWDERVLLAMRVDGNPDDARGPKWVESAARDITALGSISVLLLVMVGTVGFLIIRRQFAALALFAAAFVGGLLLNVGLKGFFDRPRPDLILPLAEVRTASFPSGHSLLSAVVYLTLAALLCRLLSARRLKLYVIATALTASLLVGLSRVYLGVHYPSDVLAGWTVGLIWAIACWLVARTLQRRGTMKRPPAEVAN